MAHDPVLPDGVALREAMPGDDFRRIADMKSDSGTKRLVVGRPTTSPGSGGEHPPA